MKNNNTNYSYNQVNSREIYSDSSYQRMIDFNRVKKIVSSFNPSLVNPIKVSYRDRKYYVFDGQHTLAALKMKNGNKDLMVDCKIYYGLTQQEEAVLFAEQNGISRTVESNAKMKALYTAGDEEIVCLRNKVESLGIKFDFTKGSAVYKITACATLYKIFKKTTQDDFEHILILIRDAWNGETESFNKEILGGMYLFYMTYKGKFNIRKAIHQFSKVSPKVIIREGRALTAGGDIRFARQLVVAYNKNLRNGRLSEGDIENR